MTISGVIPVWNGREYLGRLLDSIEHQTLPFAELLVVDNGSSDGAGDLARARGARVVRFAKNMGFAAAVNRGVAETRGELVAILNSDVELAPDWAELLVDSIDAEKVYFATGRILSARDPERIDGAWDLVSQAGMPWRAGSGAPADHAAFRQNRRIELASFTSILLRRELWKRVGPLDERFESYLEDVDFGLRCAAMGFGGYYRADAVCFHHGSASLGRWSGKSVHRMSRNQVFLVRKHFPLAWWKLLVGQGIWGLLALRHGAAWAWLRGKAEGLRRRRELPRAVLAIDQEAEIFDLQRRIGFDAYWLWYARLTGSNVSRTGAAPRYE